jgi:acetyl-CoA synthetase
MYEGAPMFPDHTRFWQMIERHEVSILYTSPTAIRSFMRFPHEDVSKSDLSSLRLLGSVGEPINPEAWLWFYKNVGAERCPVVDTWWQTETGGAMIAPFPGVTTLKPGCATQPLPGVRAQIVDAETGIPVTEGKGSLVIEKPWPGMARGIWGDPERFEKTYWNKSPALKGLYVTGDLAVKDEDGDFWIEGRMDDVLKVSGHRIGTAEVESALVEHAFINEAAAVGVPDAIRGQGIVAFVTLTEEALLKLRSKKLQVGDIKAEAITHVAKSLGSFAKPDKIRIAAQLPKTRSGKIMRRLLRELAATGQMAGDTSTLEDFSAEAAISADDG